MPEPTKEQIDALVGPATPHFAYQLRARVRELIEPLPEGHPVRAYGEEKMELLDRLGYASSKAEEGWRGRRSARCSRAHQSSASPRSARRGCSRTTYSLAPRRQRSRQSFATSPWSSRRGGFASTPSPVASSRRARSTTFRTRTRWSR